MDVFRSGGDREGIARDLAAAVGVIDHLDLLHDHYKETFALIRSRERDRDRLFLWLIVAVGLLAVEVQYPATVAGALGHLKVLGLDLDLKSFPFARVANASWVFVAAFVLRYCQLAKSVEREYPYLHVLEDKISAAIGDDEVYRREGRDYLNKYTELLNWAWFAYTVLFPLALAASVVFLLAVEWAGLAWSWPSKVFDSAFGSAIVASLALYRLRLPPFVHGKRSGETR
jgi:hypothetical protein